MEANIDNQSKLLFYIVYKNSFRKYLNAIKKAK